MPKPNPTGSDTLAADSLARGKHANPSVRAQEHAEKKRQFEARKVGTPGPGSYSPARPASASSKKTSSAGSTASFASKSKRSDFTKVQEGQGDPGAYDPALIKNLAATSKKSASRNNRAGSGSFGSQQQRKIAIEIMGEATPGPGAYNGGDMLRSGKKAALSAFDTGEKMPSSSFHSKSAQREKQQNLHVPGAGAYTPNWSACEKNMLNSANGMKSRGPRFSGADTWERAQRTEPGPGAYEIEYLRSGSKSSVSGVVGASVNKEVRSARAWPPPPPQRVPPYFSLVPRPSSRSFPGLGPSSLLLPCVPSSTAHRPSRPSLGRWPSVRTRCANCHGRIRRTARQRSGWQRSGCQRWLAASSAKSGGFERAARPAVSSQSARSQLAVHPSGILGMNGMVWGEGPTVGEGVGWGVAAAGCYYAWRRRGVRGGDGGNADAGLDTESRWRASGVT